MKNADTILARYVELSRQVTDADKRDDFDGEEKARNKFWAFVDKYMYVDKAKYGITLDMIRKTDRQNNLQFMAFC